MRSDLIYIPDSELDALIQQDTPYLDLTTLGLDIGDEPGSLSFYTREACVLCCTEEVSRILTKLGLSTAYSLPTGTQIGAGELFFTAEGSVCGPAPGVEDLPVPAFPLFRRCHKGKKYAEPGAGDLARHLSDSGTGAFPGNKSAGHKGSRCRRRHSAPHGTLGNCSHL